MTKQGNLIRAAKYMESGNNRKGRNAVSACMNAWIQKITGLLNECPMSDIPVAIAAMKLVAWKLGEPLNEPGRELERMLVESYDVQIEAAKSRGRVRHA